MARTKRSLRRIDLRVYTRYERGKMVYSFQPIGDAFVALGASLELSLFNRQTGKVYWRRRFANFHTAITKQYTLDLKNVLDGCSLFEATYTDRHGRIGAVRVIQEKFPEFVPEWFGSRAGVKRGVPKPWTALEVSKPTKSGVQVDSHGREHRFNTTSLLQAVKTRDNNVLAGPVKFFGKVDGKALKPTRGKLRCIGKSDDIVDLEQQLTDGNIAINVQTQIDFDGMMRFDWAIDCERPARVDSLGLEIPIKPEHAEYFYQFPGAWGSAMNAGEMPELPVRLGFRPYIWIGDNDCGFSWFSESDRNWFGGGTEIVRRGGAVCLRLHFVGSPIRLLPQSQRPESMKASPEMEASMNRALSAVQDRIDVYGPVDYTMGMQATPVKAEKKDAWDQRTLCLTQNQKCFKPRMSYSRKALDRIAAKGVRTVVLFEHWSDFEAHSIPIDEKKVQRVVDDCHARGLKVLFYFGFLISDEAPEWRDTGPTAVMAPKRGYPVFNYAPQRPQSAWIVCLNSAWQDMVADGIARTMDRFGIDGVYLDGTEWPWECSNTLHGCGEVRSDNTVSPTHTIFAARSAMRRLYNAVKARKPNAQVNAHNSTCMVMPTLGFATGSWDGEQFQDIKGRETAASLLPMDSFRCEFMGRQWGVPAEFLAYGKGFTFEEAWAIPLLHDVPRRPNNERDDLDLASDIWAAMDRFGRERATWRPYWANEELVKSRTPGVYVSLYQHPTRGALAVVANITGKRQKVDVQFNWRKLKLRKDRTAITDLMTGRKAGTTGSLPIFGWKMLWLKPDTIG